MAKRLSQVIREGLARRTAAKKSPIRDAFKGARKAPRNYGRRK
jgi:hypothetical protein